MKTSYLTLKSKINFINSKKKKIILKSIGNIVNKKKNPIIFTNARLKTKIWLLAKDISKIAPHSNLKKREKGKTILKIIEYANQIKKNFIFLFLEEKKIQKKVHLWISKFPTNPLVQMAIYDIKSCEKLSFIGNCSKWSIPFLSFDKFFNQKPPLIIVKNLFIEFFSSKKKDQRIEGFFDHVISFCYYNEKIWVRVYQINFSKIVKKNSFIDQLIEIGPRLVLNILKIWSNYKKTDLIYDSTIFPKVPKNI